MLELNGSESFLSYAEFEDRARNAARQFLAAGIQPGEHVILQTRGIATTLIACWAGFLSGVVVVPMPPVPVFDPAAASVARLCAVHAMLGAPPILIEASDADAFAAFATAQGWPSPRFLPVQRLLAPASGAPQLPRLQPDDLAMLPLTSGSTGTPKAVRLTHRNILAMVAGTNQQNRFGPDDVALNWMPLDHPGALVFLGVVPMEAGAGQVHVPTTTILAAPVRWLELCERYRASISWAPNFAFALLSDAIDKAPQTYDLSDMRFLVSAGEHVAPETLRAALERLTAQGLVEGAMRPAFGMAETCSGITWSPGLSIETLDAENDGVLPLGGPIPGARLRITNEADVVLPEGETGFLQLKGPSVLGGYHDNPDANAQAMRPGNWFRTGDLAFVRDGQLYIAGRGSEVIVVNGLNHSPHEIEAIASSVDGVSEAAAAFAIQTPGKATDDVVVVFAPDGGGCEDSARMTEIAREVKARIARQLGLRPAHVLPIADEDLPRTSIGKIQRSTLRKWFEDGRLDAIRETMDRALPAPANAPTVRVLGETASTGRAEATILGVWREMLGLTDISPDANFFEIGGHSLLLVQVHARLQEHFPQMMVVDMFTHATPRALAEHLFPAARAVRTRAGRTAARGGDIAVIGMACRFPGADSIDEFWDNLRNGRESIARFTPEELVRAGFDPALVSHPDFVGAAPVLRDARGFDATLFGYSTREAELLDPQQRIFLQVAWECMESAGHANPDRATSVGAWVGASMNTYFLNNVWPNRDKLDPSDRMEVFTLDSMGGFQCMVANDKDYISTRASFKLGLTGPSVNTQTACSTGLVVIHQAVQALRAGECDMALAGTASVQSPIANGHLWQEGMIVSKDGHCRAFDAEASGTVFGSGVGAVLLKPLDRALADGDHIWAVIKGTAINNDGADKIGYMAPSAAGQEAVARAALEDAGVPAESVSFVEAHGTGTLLGDPVEMASLRAAYGRFDRSPLTLGAVKTNIGHLQISSGIAGFIKAALALHHAEIPPTLHFRSPNPALDYAAGPFVINDRPMAWNADAGGGADAERKAAPRRAGVNSLGIGGTNAHVILEEAPHTAQRPDLRPAATDRPVHLVVLHAATERALDKLVERMARAIASLDPREAADAAFTLNTGRRSLPWRTAAVFAEPAMLPAALATAPRQRATSGTFWLDATPLPVAPGMGADLFASSPVFADAVALCDATLFAPGGIPGIASLIRGEKTQQGEAQQVWATGGNLHATAFAWCLAQLWLSWGVTPLGIAGPSSLVDVIEGRSPLASLDTGGTVQAADHGARIQPICPMADGTDLWPALLAAVGDLYCSGCAVDWAAFDMPYERRRLPLPCYPFETQPYWMEPPAPAPLDRRPAACATHPLIDRATRSRFLSEDTFELRWDCARHPFIADHRIHDHLVVAGASHVAMVIASQNGAMPVVLADVSFERPLVVAGGGADVVLVVGKDATAPRRFALYAANAPNDAPLASGAIGGTIGGTGNDVSPLNVAHWRDQLGQPMSADAYDRILANRGIVLGPGYKAFAELRRDGQSALARLTAFEPLTGDTAAEITLHPVLIDAAFALMLAVCSDSLPAKGTFVPAGFSRLVLHALPDGEELWAHGVFSADPAENRAIGDVTIATANGRAIMTVKELAGTIADLALPAADEGLLQIGWYEAALAPGRPAAMIAPGIPDDLRRSLTELGCKILDTGTEDQLRPGDRLVVYDAGPETTLAALQAGLDRPDVEIILLTSGAVRTSADALPGSLAACRQAGVPAMAKVARLEHPDLRLRWIDGEPETSPATLAKTILAAGPMDLAIRAERVLVPRLQRLALPILPAVELNPEASYLVTGASGAVAARLIPWLVRHGARTIVCLSRSGRVADAAVAAAAEEGARIIPLAATLGVDPLEWPEGLPPLRGILHAAGLLLDASVATSTPVQVAKTMLPKLDGAKALVEGLPIAELDFLLLFSSAASVIGNEGQVAYAAANGSLDALAAVLREQGIPATAISWGPWDAGGMAARSARTGAHFARLGFTPLGDAQVDRALSAAITGEHRHFMALECDWPRYLRETGQVGDDPRSHFFAQLAPGNAGVDLGANTLQTARNGFLATVSAAIPADREGLVRGLLLDAVARTLGFDDAPSIAPDQPLAEQGLDSLGNLAVRRVLNEAFERNFPIGIFFEYPTIDDLSAYLLAELAGPPLVANTPASSQAGGDDDDIELLSLDELEALALAEIGQSQDLP